MTYLKYILNKTLVLPVLVWILIRSYVYNKVYRQSFVQAIRCMFSIRFHLYGIYLLYAWAFLPFLPGNIGKKDILFCPCNKLKCFYRNTDYRNLGTRVLSMLHATKDRMSDINLCPVIAL